MSINHNLPLTIDGVPNTSNPLVIAGILDVIGINLTLTLNDIGARGSVTGDDARVLIGVQNLLKNLREVYGDQHDVNESCVDWAEQLKDEIREYKEKNAPNLEKEIESVREVARQLGIEDLFDQYLAETRNSLRPSVSDAADAILNDLRASGSIGGSRAV